MYPNIKKGDAIVVEDLKIGDILVHKHDGKVILHRIIKITNTGEFYIFNTKGDNNDNQDNWDIYENDVIGIVRLKVSYIGYPSVWLSEQF